MQAPIITAGNPVAVKEKTAAYAGWLRVVLLSVLAYEGAGALAGGAMLIAAPDGKLMSMPTEIMHGTFANFLIPGIILLLLGVITTIAFFIVLRKRTHSWQWAVGALIVLLGWFWIEIAILLELHWLHAMWGLPVVIGLIAAFPMMPEAVRQKAFLWCGILSSALYVAINIIVPLQWNAYSMTSHTISELSAIGAPTRMLWNILATPYNFLFLAFAWGVYRSAHDNRRLRIAARLLLVFAAFGFLWPFAPMHMREALAAGQGSLSDTLHLALGATTELFYLLSLAFMASALGKPFRVYSLITLILVLVFGVLTFIEAPGISANEPTPMIGTWERINIGLFMAWTVVLAVVLLRKENK